MALAMFTMLAAFCVVVSKDPSPVDVLKNRCYTKGEWARRSLMDTRNVTISGHYTSKCSRKMFPHSDDVRSWYWKVSSPHCQLPQSLEPRTFCQILNRRTLVGVGDSHLRDLFISLYVLLNVQEVPPTHEDGGTISVLHANYGGNCPGTSGLNVTDAIAKACQGQYFCRLPLSLSLLGRDPAHHCGKSLVVDYRCGNGAVHTTTVAAEATRSFLRIVCDDGWETIDFPYTMGSLQRFRPPNAWNVSICTFTPWETTMHFRFMALLTEDPEGPFLRGLKEQGNQAVMMAQFGSHYTKNYVVRRSQGFDFALTVPARLEKLASSLQWPLLFVTTAVGHPDCWNATHPLTLLPTREASAKTIYHWDLLIQFREEILRWHGRLSGKLGALVAILDGFPLLSLRPDAHSYLKYQYRRGPIPPTDPKAHPDCHHMCTTPGPLDSLLVVLQLILKTWIS